MPDEATQEDKEAREKKFDRNVRLAFFIPFGFLLVIFLIAGLYSFVEPSTPTEKKDFVQAVGILVAGFAGVIGLFFTWRNLRLTRENTDRQLQVAREGQERTQESTQETLRITEQGQITERFTRAIEQLGAMDDERKPKLEIRLGGIYTLERIAKDSPERDYSTVMEVLTTYARENAPYYPRPEAEEAAEQEEGGKQDKADEPQRLAFSQEQRADIRAIGDVIRRLHGKNGVPREYLVRLDLYSTNLQEANLQEANLQEVNFYGAYLQEANLSRANLSRAYLSGAYLSGAYLYGADLPRANLQLAYLRRANLRRANLSRANLSRANLQLAYLRRANLQEANLQEANLYGAYLQEANLSRANLSRANLSRANLYGADLQGADSLTQAQLEQAFGDENTKLPEGVEMPKSWIQSQGEQTEENE